MAGAAVVAAGAAVVAAGAAAVVGVAEVVAWLEVVGAAVVVAVGAASSGFPPQADATNRTVKRTRGSVIAPVWHFNWSRRRSH